MFWDIIYSLALQGTTVMVTTHFMDEAEHCDEIGFIYEGNLIASGSPDRLKQNIAGTLLSISTTQPMELLEGVEASALSYLDIYPSGASIRILVDAHQLPQFAVYDYEIISPVLEDVFVYLVKLHRQEGVA
jgi:ABC-2 type transport system ATP-binding protein